MSKINLKQLGMDALSESHTTFLKLVRDGSAQDVAQNRFGELGSLCSSLPLLFVKFWRIFYA